MSPRVFTSRSRWMASCGTRSRRAVDAQQPFARPVVAAHHHPARQAEVAVEPRVQQRRRRTPRPRSCVTAGPAGVGLRLDPQVGAVGVGADHPEAGAPPGRHRRARPTPPRCRPGRCSAGRPRATARRSATAVNPAASRRAETLATAWNGDGEASRNDERDGPIIGVSPGAVAEAFPVRQRRVRLAAFEQGRDAVFDAGRNPLVGVDVPAGGGHEQDAGAGALGVAGVEDEVPEAVVDEGLSQPAAAL